MLGTARTPPDLVAVLRFLSRMYGARFSRTLIILRESVVPILALVGGVVVCAIALSVFGPLLVMIQTVSMPTSAL